MKNGTDINEMTLEDLRLAYAVLLNQNSTLESQMDVLIADNNSLAAQNTQAQQDITRLTCKLKEAQDEVSRLNEIVALMKDKLYGRSCEKGFAEPDTHGEIEPFNEAEKQAAFAKKIRKKQTPRSAVDYSGMPEVIEEHTLNKETCTCSHCGSAMQDIGYDIKTEIRHVPEQLVVVRHRRHKYVCKVCSKANAEGKNEDIPVEIRRAEGPQLPLGNSHAGPSLIAHIIHEKYALSMPLYRTWTELSTKHHLPDKRATMCSWVTKSYEKWFAQLYGLVQAELLTRNLLHIDETTVICLEERRKQKAKKTKRNTGAISSSKSYMWVFCTAECDTPLYLFVFGPSRGREVVERTLPGWSGTIVTDAHSAYLALPHERFTRVACGVHIRRYFIRAAKANTKNDKIYSAAQEGVDRINRIFHLEHKIKRQYADNYEQIKLERNHLLRPEMDSFRAWAQDKLDHFAVPGTKLYEALNYALGNWDDFENILKDGRYPTSNNCAERAIRPFCTGRKNWLFCESSYGSEVSAGLYSLVTTARANGLDDEKYLEWVLTEMPKAAYEGTLEERLADFLPWSGKVPETCRSLGSVEIFKDDPIIDIDPTEFDRN